MKIQFIYFAICLILVNCKESQPELSFKYADQTMVINCDLNNSELFNEAIYNFEAILLENYPNRNLDLTTSYRAFLKETTSNQVNYNNISNQHSLDLFEALNSIDDLWLKNDNKLLPNYNHKIFSCIGENIKDKDIKTTYNALLSTNSMSMRMLKDVLLTKSKVFYTDKYLATFVALELYYSKLSNVDLSKKEVKPLDTKLNEATDPHAGHNHE